MKFEIDNVSIIYPNEDNAIARNVTIEDDGEYLQFNFYNGSNDTRPGGMSLDRSQIVLLTDTLNLVLKNKLVV